MDTIDSTPPETGTPDRHSRRARLAAVAVLAAGGLAAGATGVAMAADGSGSPTPTPSASASDGGGYGGGPGVPGQKGRERFGHGPHGVLGLFGFGGALHGEVVVPDGDSGYQTIAVQRGKVTSVGSDEVTVKSDDGFSETYAVPADALVNAARDGLETIEKGAEVSVVAVQDGGDPTATRIVDLSRFEQLREQLRPDRDEAPGTTDGSVESTVRSGANV